MGEHERDAWDWAVHQEEQCHKRMLELGYVSASYAQRLALRTALYTYELVHYREIPDHGGL